MRIVIEGIDGVGKSTLAKALAAQIGGALLQTYPGPPEDEVEFLKRLIDATLLAYSNPAVVFDRHPAVSEYVYGLAFEDNRFGLGSSTVAGLLSLSADLVVFCYADPEKLRIKSTGPDDERMTACVRENVELVSALYLGIESALVAAGVRVMRVELDPTSPVEDGKVVEVSNRIIESFGVGRLRVSASDAEQALEQSAPASPAKVSAQKSSGRRARARRP